MKRAAFANEVWETTKRALAVVISICLLCAAAAAQRIEVATTQEITEGAQIWDLAFSPDGKRLAYIDRGSLLTREISSGQTKRLVEKIAIRIGGFTPEGGSILFTQVESKVLVTYRISLDGGQPTLVAPGNVQQVSLSPDGKRIAYVHNERTKSGWHSALIVAGSDGRGEKELMRQDTGFFGAPRWSPEGDRIAVIGPKGVSQQLIAVHAGTGQAEILTTWHGVIDRIAWLPATGGILIVCRSSATWAAQLWRLTLPDRAMTKLFDAPKDFQIFTAIAQPDGYLVAAGKESTAETFWDGMLGAVFGWRQPAAYDVRKDLVLIRLLSHEAGGG